MEKTSCFVIAIACVIGSFTPVISQEVGSAAAYRVLADIQNRQADREISWNQAKKVGVLPPDHFPGAPEATQSISKLTEGLICRLEQTDFRVFDIVDENTLRVSYYYRDQRRELIVEGCPVAGLADGDTIRVVGFLKCLGPKDYHGSTIQTVRMLTAAEQREQIREIKSNQAELAAAKLRLEYPAWSLKDGSEVSGKFVKYGAGQVLLEALTGEQFKVKLTDFSKDSADKLRELIKAPKKPIQTDFLDSL